MIDEKETKSLDKLVSDELSKNGNATESTGNTYRLAAIGGSIGEYHGGKKLQYKCTSVTRTAENKKDACVARVFHAPKEMTDNYCPFSDFAKKWKQDNKEKQ